MRRSLLLVCFICSPAPAQESKEKADPWVGTYKAFERFSEGLYRPTDRAAKMVNDIVLIYNPDAQIVMCAIW